MVTLGMFLIKNDLLVIVHIKKALDFSLGLFYSTLTYPLLLSLISREDLVFVLLVNSIISNSG